jgi:hypothetical protein
MDATRVATHCTEFMPEEIADVKRSHHAHGPGILASKTGSHLTKAATESPRKPLG